MSIELIVDLVLVALLIAVIASAFVLNRRIEAMREGQSEMAKMVEQLNAVTNTAQLSIEKLKATSSEINNELAKERSKARALADELALITEAGDNLANRLEQKLSKAADSSRGRATAKPTLKDLAEEEDESDQNDGRAEMLEALKQAR